MRFVGRGHEAVRATHGKTLEFTPHPDITERATCVVAVGTDAQPARPLAGPVRITITAGGHEAVVHALANPQWDPSATAVVRRSPLRLPGTFATDADSGAADLPRDLVAALRDPDVEVIVEVQAEVQAGEPVLVLAAADPARALDLALVAEIAAAEVVVAGDDGARALVGRRDRAPSVVTARTLVVATDGLPTFDGPLDGIRVETLGLAPQQAVAAASASRAPVVYLPDVGEADIAELADVPAAYRVVFDVPSRRVAAALIRAREVRATQVVTLAQPFTQPWTYALDDPLELVSHDTVACCLHPMAGLPDPRPRAAIEALLADGVPTRTAARALAELTGWSRRRAYDAVLELGRSAGADREDLED